MEIANIINVEDGENELVSIGRAQKHVVQDGTYAWIMKVLTEEVLRPVILML